VSEPSTQSTEGHVPGTVAKQQRERRIWDVALSIALLVLANAAFLLGAIFAIFSVAFIDYCPQGCDSNSAVSVQITVGAILAFLGLLGTILTIVLLARRRRGWWVALATLLLIVVGWIVGFLLYAAALNYH
jgi:uncharacterized BrkB/YihY/UPF0761 family membrane protein